MLRAGVKACPCDSQRESPLALWLFQCSGLWLCGSHMCQGGLVKPLHIQWNSGYCINSFFFVLGDKVQLLKALSNSLTGPNLTKEKVQK